MELQMRVYYKNRIQKFTDLLIKANATLERQIEANHSVEVYQELLTDMQSTAIEIGGLIEKYQANGQDVVKLLEDSCELIWMESQKTTKDKIGIQKAMNQKFREIKAAISTFEDEYEIVYLPYKASMWDSLESVWKASCEDKRCNSVVIPIPYYDKNPDGSIKEEHYEGDLYPDYVPITDYKSYDFEGKHPDVIYVHNPYDDYNFITSVHPFFYSRNIKKYTDKLVYIPYFILRDINLKYKFDRNEINIYCKTPVILNANYAIVQSKEMQKCYKKVIRKWLGNDKYIKLNFEKKILGTGSPKIDKIEDSIDQNFCVPCEWEEILYTKEHRKKVTFLYNTSIGSFLKSSEDMLIKIENVLNTFYNSRNEIALWWRSHPLMMATINSMRPELKKKYERLVKDYKEGKWGIYDESTELERAIHMTDAYYGDYSSLIQLYKKTGKPILIQQNDFNMKKQV